MVNFGLRSREQSHSPNGNHSTIQFESKGHQEPHNEVWSLSLIECIVRFESGILTLNPLNPLGTIMKSVLTKK